MPQSRIADGARCRAWASGIEMACDVSRLRWEGGEGAQEGRRQGWVREEARQCGKDGQGRQRVVSGVFGKALVVHTEICR